MAFIQEELRNFSAKGWQGILGTGNRSTAPDNLTYYEEPFSNSLSIDARSVLTQLEDVPPASNQTEADTNVAANNTIMRGYGTPADPTTALHLTPTPNNKAFMCTSTYGDMNTRLKNFIQPQMIQNGNYASIGYTARLYQGNPNAGGVEIPTTIDQVGADVGWFFMYGSGAVVVSSSFTGISDPNDVWLVCYQYIGPTAVTVGSTPLDSSFTIKLDRKLLEDGTRDNMYPKMAPKSMHVGGKDILNIPTKVNNTGGVVIPAGEYLYLDDVNVQDDFSFDAIYKGFNSTDGYELTIPKKFPTQFYLDGLGFTRNMDIGFLGYEIELWSSQGLNHTRNVGEEYYGFGAGMRKVKTFTHNLININDLTGVEGRNLFKKSPSAANNIVLAWEAPVTNFNLSQGAYYGNQIFRAVGSTLIFNWEHSTTVAGDLHLWTDYDLIGNSKTLTIQSLPSGTFLTPTSVEFDSDGYKTTFSGYDPAAGPTAGDNKFEVHASGSGFYDLKLYAKTPSLKDYAQSGVFHMKIRDLNQGIEAWINQTISIRKFPIITTDSSLSADICHGYYVNTKIM